MLIDKSNGISKYIQLKDILKREMLENFSPGDLFLTEKQIMNKYNISCATVGSTMKALVKEDCVHRKRGKGTYIKAFKLPQSRSWSTELIINRVGLMGERSYNPFSWFIQNEIERGIINNYDGPVKILDNHELRAAILAGNDSNIILLNAQPEIIELCAKARGKVLTFGKSEVSNSNKPFEYVHCSQLPGIYELMKYLIVDLGHRRIGIINTDTPHHRDRFAGYQIGLRTFGIEYDESLVQKVKRGYEKNGYVAMRELLKQKNPPTAVFVDTDLKAIGSMQAIKDAGLRIPEDISIAGFDDMPDAANLDPPLTSIKKPYYKMGKLAVEMLTKSMKTGEPMTTATLSSELIIRQSCCQASMKLTGKAGLSNKSGALV